jgi:hypothetical protein
MRFFRDDTVVAVAHGELILCRIAVRRGVREENPQVFAEASQTANAARSPYIVLQGALRHD